MDILVGFFTSMMWEYLSFAILYLYRQYRNLYKHQTSYTCLMKTKPTNKAIRGVTPQAWHEFKKLCLDLQKTHAQCLEYMVKRIQRQRRP